MNFSKINSNYTKHCLPLQEIKIMFFFFLKYISGRNGQGVLIVTSLN